LHVGGLYGGSEQAAMERAFVDPADALAFLAVTPRQPFDCMLEAKEKDRALLKLRAELRTRGVAEAALRDARASSAAHARRAL
jgi:UV DNA damage repair endonuclease